MPQGCCKLCNNQCELRLSHFIPKFIGKWLKETSATGFIRMNHSINKRSQDITKEYWLCGDCELLFSGWETQFANKVFFPMMNKGLHVVKYDSWLAKFCASLSWRTLTYMRSQNPTDEKRPEEKDKAENALADFLLGRSKNLGVYEQHLIPTPAIESTTVKDMPENINRYLMRAMHMDVISNSKTFMIYTKLPGFILLGLANYKHAPKMRSSRIAMGASEISPRAFTLPVEFSEYMFEKARDITAAYASMNQAQKDVITQSLMKNPERVQKSLTIEALSQDHRMFGKKALK